MKVIPQKVDYSLEKGCVKTKKVCVKDNCKKPCPNTTNDIFYKGPPLLGLNIKNNDSLTYVINQISNALSL